ncbi:Molybdopterin oxidoreductase [Desulfacinum infernum DSM 9756]|uniref:Molybdopterin oxidoreductase n=1 Tax=Desulfacinum infernum DSM 9756 TaxID=1121391 RepID=A0A1M5IRS3_9BACT|nr:molybdopterin-dependent oxidoreductase [Desulfacinum infernum]SHG30473.1 Molybdopterin oxidoreductase [Desulfacinum infernum DSM 9756]
MSTTRRNFLKGALALSGVLTSAGCMKQGRGTKPWLHGAPDPDAVHAEKVVRTVCLGCHSACGLQVKVQDGVVVKISGNPYHPNVREPHIPYDTDPQKAALTEGTVCAKGGATLQTLYNPYRLRQPLKRVGPRGSGKWKTITWEQAYEEIINGGDLFGEGHVDGLKAIRSFDPIDPEAPELGPKANQLCFMPGRIEHGRKEFTDRWFHDCFGTVNKRLDHTSICETSHHVGIDLCFDNKHHTKPDIMNAEYILFFGTTPYEANFPMQAMARKLNYFRERGGTMVVVDPRFSNSAAKAARWIPILPGTDAAFALGMMRWMMEHDRVDLEYLSFPNKKAALEGAGHLTWSDATYLVRQDTRAILRDGKTPLVMKDGQLVSAEEVDRADLLVDTTVDGVRVVSVYKMLTDRVMERTVAQYAEICGVEPAAIEREADDFSSHGRRAVVDFYRGSVQHTNGTYTARTLEVLNFLIGNVSWKGGCEAHGGSHWHETGGKPGNPYHVKKPQFTPGKVKAWGVNIDRHKNHYEETTEFKKNGYPAKRPWFPFAYHNVYQEVFPSIGAQYPYPIKCLITYWNNVLYSSPAGVHLAEAVKDPKKLPLFIAIDIVMGETSSLADYILPCRHFLEDYGTPHVAPTILTTTSGFRQPVVEPVFKDTKMLEEIFIDLGLKMGLPGFGKDGLGPGRDLYTPWDWYKLLVANIAYGDKPGDSVPGATEEEKVRYVVERGGRFEDYRNAYKGPYTKHAYKGPVFIYNEKLATVRDSMTGQYYDGLPIYEPVKDCLGRPVNVDPSKYPFFILTYHPVYHAQARTAASPWLMGVTPKEDIQINAGDAARLGIRHGDPIRVYSESHPEGVRGKAWVTEGVRPGIVVIPHSLGHWQYGSRSFQVDGKPSEAAPWIGRGCSANPVMLLDPHLKDVCLQDPIGGSASFYDTRVAVEKV